MTFKTIKTTPFTYDGQDHQHLIVSYKGRVLSFSTLEWADEPEGSFEIDDNGLSIKGKPDVIKEEKEGRTYLKLLPKLDLNIL